VVTNLTLKFDISVIAAISPDGISYVYVVQVPSAVLGVSVDINVVPSYIEAVTVKDEPPPSIAPSFVFTIR